MFYPEVTEGWFGFVLSVVIYGKSEAVFGGGERFALHLGDIGGDCLLRDGPDVAEPAGVFRQESLAVAEQVADYLHLAVAVGARADPDGRHGDGRSDLRGELGGDTFEDHGEDQDGFC